MNRKPVKGVNTGSAAQWAFEGLSQPVSRLFRALPDVFLLMGMASPEKDIRILVKGAPLSIPADLERLTSICQQAPFGKGDKTVIDTNVRRVLETDRCQIQFEMGELLKEISSRFSLPENITADFYKLLYYREGDFFLEHVDSKKSPQHVLTLAIDVGSDCKDGGELRFPVTSMTPPPLFKAYTHTKEEINQEKELMRQEKERKKNRPYEKWQSSGRGSWACWFATQAHSVTPLKSGYRLIAVYNISVPDTDGLCFSKQPPVILSAKQPDAPLLQMPVDVIRLVVSAAVSASFNSVLRLGRTCKYLHALTRNYASLLASYLTARKPLIHKALEVVVARSLGFVLQHKYSFDGAETLPLCRLRGRDRILAEAFVLSGLPAKLSVRPCFVRMESFRAQNSGPIIVPEFRICKAVTEQVEEYHHDEFTKAERKLLPTETFNCSSANYFLSGSDCENDADITQRFWPFWDTLWLSNYDYLRCTHEPMASQAESEEEVDEAEGPANPALAGKREEIWGNGPIFNLYWYYEAALLLEFAVPDEKAFLTKLTNSLQSYSDFESPKFRISKARSLQLLQSAK